MFVRVQVYIRTATSAVFAMIALVHALTRWLSAFSCLTSPSFTSGQLTIVSIETHYPYRVAQKTILFYSGGASAVKEPGHLEFRKSSSQVLHFFPQKSWRHFQVCRPQNTGRQRCFTVKIKQIKRSDMVTFLFSVHAITEAKQYAGLGRAWARAVDLHLTWRALV